MVDVEKGQISEKKGSYDGDDTEAAAAKLWAVYVSEAEKYDKGLVESWKSDMDGLLIFAALFSAIVAAFIIESYKTLNSDSGDLTVQLLTQISQQLAASANASTFHISPSTPFTPAVTSLVCNALWFISLGFSLATALIATLVQQWAREFLHKGDLRSAPVIRARIFSYLYYGLKRFKMHTVVEVIPVLLHTSLMLFFAGLVAFLIPVNVVMALIVAGVLFIVAVTYLTFTLLPLRYLDCPYRTPISGAFWTILLFLKSFWRQHRRLTVESSIEAMLHTEAVLDSPLSLDETMVEAMSRTAMEPSVNRSERDHKALLWTVKSLTDHFELEPFVEAIPELLWGPKHRRHVYEEHILRLVHNPEVQLHNRIASLLHSCDTGILSAEDSKRRRITCYKAFWALARLSIQSSNATVDFSHIYHRWHVDTTLRMTDWDTYAVSALALMEWSTLGVVEQQLLDLREHLIACRDRTSSSVDLDLRQIASTLDDIRLKFRKDRPTDLPNQGSSTGQIVELLSQVDFLLSVRYRIVFRYLAQSAHLSSAPYHWGETRAAMVLDPSAHIEDVVGSLISVSSQLERLNITPDATEIAWIDTSTSILLSFWQPAQHVPIPTVLISFLNERRSDSALRKVLRNGGRIEFYLWSNFPTTISPRGLLRLRFRGRRSTVKDVFIVMWRLASLGVNRILRDKSRLAQLDSVVDALPVRNSLHAPICRSITALIKNQILDEIEVSATAENLVLLLSNQHVFPKEVVAEFPETLLPLDSISSGGPASRYLNARVTEGRIGVLAEFLDHCVLDDMPYMAAETLKRTIISPPKAAVHPTHQIRLANSIQSIFTTGMPTDLLEVIINLNCWNLYAAVPSRRSVDRWVPLFAWLNNATARHQIKDTFIAYEQKLVLADSTPVLSRLRDIVQGIMSTHPQRNAEPATDMGEQLVS
ncbi:hypothetical protein B0H19DRAFT_312574 [Mycena capillaripes]|nr:hypothetical protein B0H19DRAFT_312574 [Mycena capillaripes]